MNNEDKVTLTFTVDEIREMLLPLYEFSIFDMIRNDQAIDNPKWLQGQMRLYGKLLQAVEGGGLFYPDDAVQGWIPVSERLPEKEEFVLATVWGCVVIAWRNRYGKWESAEDIYVKGDVAAWMPLPDPYKGGEDE